MIRDSLTNAFDILPALLGWVKPESGESEDEKKLRLRYGFVSCRFLELAIRTGTRDPRCPADCFHVSLMNQIQQMERIPTLTQVYMDWLDRVLKDPDEQSTPIDIMRELNLDGVSDARSHRTLFADDWGIYLIDERREIPVLYRFDREELTVGCDQDQMDTWAISFNAARIQGTPRKFQVPADSLSWITRHIPDRYQFET
jgi:hypothetical protein